MENTEGLVGTMANDIIIAEFWGYKFHKADQWWKLNGMSDHYYIENPNGTVQRLPANKLRFHLDWNWIIPVIKKINKLDLLDCQISLVQDHINFCVNVKEKIVNNDLDGVNKLVVDFIKSYNGYKK